MGETRTVHDDLAVLANGLTPPATRPARVIVVGAGMAGLVAASELQRAGHDPIIIEAQQRVGGRCLTLREPFAPGLWAEAGAMRIPKSHRLTHALIDRYGLTTAPFTMDNPEAYCYFGGRRVRHTDLGADPTAMGFEVADHERMPPGRLWGRELEPFSRTYLTLVAPGADPAWSAELHAPIMASLKRRDSAAMAAALAAHFDEARANMARRWPDDAATHDEPAHHRKDA